MKIGEVIGNYSNPNSLGSKFRRRRSAPLRRMIERTFAERGSVSILDVGGIEDYWSIFDPDFLWRNRVSIVLLNLSDDVQLPLRPHIFQSQVGDGCALPYESHSFDICHSNSVIEHVGSWSRKVAFAGEAKRVARNYFIQTPNFWFPWEPHFGMLFYHWLPEPCRLWIALHRDLAFSPRAKNIDEGMRAVEYASMLNAAMMRYLFDDGELIRERIAGLTKSLVSVRW